MFIRTERLKTIASGRPKWPAERMKLRVSPALDPALLQQRRGAMMPFPLNAPHSTYFFRARNAIYYLFRHLGLDADAPVLAPSYHSGNEIEAIRAAGAPLRFYGINRQLEPDLDEIAALCRREPRPRVLFAIHFLGWPQPLEALSAICRQYGLTLVEDCALAMLSEKDGRPLGSFGDYAIFCLYKTVPVPNGGMLVQNGHVIDEIENLELRRGGLISLTGRMCELLLERSGEGSWHLGEMAMSLKRSIGRGLSAVNVARTPVGDIGFDLDKVDLAISGVTRRLLRHFDYDDVRQKRRANFLQLQCRLRGRTTFIDKPLHDGVCPLFFPLLVADKTEAATALRERGIDSVELWNTTPDGHDAGGDVAFLRRHVLELPVHQDLDSDHVAYMSEQVLSLGLGVSRE